MMQEDLASIKAQVHNALDRYFPEFLTVFKDWTGKAALHFLKKGYLPEDIQSSSEEELMAEAHEALLEDLVLHVPGASQMMEIKGGSSITVAGFFAEVGDLSNYRDPRQIIKLAGLNLKLNESGLFKGQTTITKRGCKRLRSLLYQVARPLSIHNEGFKQLHYYYKNRPNNPLTGKQSFVALSRKLIKILFVIGTRNCAFDETRMMRDIPQLKNLQEAAA